MKKKMTYKQAGVDIDKANRLVKDIKRLIGTTRIKGSIGSIGGFGGLFDTARSGVKGSLLVASTDGVGTKLKIAQIADVHNTVGIDLVAMCVNDILCLGARPLIFLDYFATGGLDGRTWKEVIQGIVKGCRQAGCELLGGETAEMPGMYPKGEYDLAGFSVGVIDRKKIIDGSKIKPGDVLLGLASSGLHSNGYSLVRKIFTKKQLKKDHRLFLKPTFIYVKPVLDVIGKFTVKGIANITGGGFHDNIIRILPKSTKAVVQKGSWKIPGVFKLIMETADIEERELYRTFNMGVGMILVLRAKDAMKAKLILAKKFKLQSWIIGKIIKGKRGVEIA
jgi:phosphoribosylformylglycinamidine cyclo-ligase